MVGGKLVVDGNNIINGILRSNAGNEYFINDGIPDFTYPKILHESDLCTKAEYDSMSDEFYDNAIDWLFKVFYEDEGRIRRNMVNYLDIRNNCRVLEIGCGTGRSTIYIAKKMKKGISFVQDLSSYMVKKCRDNLSKCKMNKNFKIEYFIGNGAYLPFPNGFFDAVFHFGGINLFAEKERTFYEINRVVRTGGKVVIGDESMAPWLREKEYGKMLINNNRLLAQDVPVMVLPENAQDVCIRYILGNTFYLIDYKVGKGIPKVNIDLPHKGKRGGTIRTRYFGQLEGVTENTKRLAQRAIEVLSLSMHEWLDRIVRKNAWKVLKNK